MVKNVDLAKRISKNLNKDWQADLEELNVFYIFKSIYENTAYSTTIANTIVAYVIYAYDNDSSWLNYKQERFENKERILLSLGASTKIATYNAVASNSIPAINDVIALYLQSQCTFKWKTIVSLLDYSAEMLRFANQRTEEEKSVDKINKEGEVKTLTSQYDIEKLAKVNILKSELFDKSISARATADKLMEELGKEFLQLNQATKVDFGFEITEEKAIPFYEDWRDFVRNIVIPARKKEKEERNAKKAVK